MRVLLLNPPAPPRSLRDYYCPGLAKSDYYYHPVDLLYLSGTLSARHEVKVVDAPPRRLGVEGTLAAAAAFRPDAVISLVSMPTFARDDAFLARLKAALPGARIVATGDLCLERAADLLEGRPHIDACLLDFSTPDAVELLEASDGRTVSNAVYRWNGTVVAGGAFRARGTFSVPLPLYGEFPPELYSLPIVRDGPFATVLTDFGCAFDCSFCPMTALGYKIRPIPEVLDEIDGWVSRGYREVHFRDQTFGCAARRTLELCAGIGRRFPRLSWSCFSRVDVLDDERLAAMAAAGCHSVIFGIEFEDERLSREFGKRTSLAQAAEAVARCRRHGVRAAGTFMIGLPGQDAAAIRRTGALASSLDLDFASFNIAMPRMGTPWRKELIARGRVDPDDWDADTGSGTSAWREPALDRASVGRLAREVERGFYLRPRRVLKTLSGLRSWPELRAAARSGLGVILK